jgi:predicted aspartyl protease
MDAETVLLGMTFLKRVEFTQREDRLTLRPLVTR